MTEQNRMRAELYRFFSRIFQSEPDAAAIAAFAGLRFPEDGPWANAGARWNRCAAALGETDPDSLAVDYARVFLGAGLAEAAAAFPFESVYTSPKHIIMQDAWSRMRERFAQRGLALAAGNADLMEDHVSAELAYMAMLCETGTEAEQAEFFRLHLTGWVPQFCADVERYAETELYRAAAALLRVFLSAEADETQAESARGVYAPKFSPAPEGAAERSAALSAAEMERVFSALAEKYDVYGPAADEKGVVRFRMLTRFADIVNDRQSDFSPKEVYYPISQTLFRFDENSYQTVLPDPEKPALIFAHPCDINAVRRLDNIFLKNGGQADVYYEALRSRVKFAMLECPAEGYPGCWCVSMGTNKSEDYALAVRIEPEGVRVLVRDTAFEPFFAGARQAEYTPAFVEKNQREVTLPRVAEVRELQKVFDLPFWKDYNDKCISCGGCNTVCPTCSCYETSDYLDQENSRKGERRRVWASCMIPEFTRTTGGHVARPTPEKLMRFKALHKVFDYNARFGGREHMCVGCSRCVLRCPEEIDFLDTIRRLHDGVEQLIAEQEAQA